MRARLHPSTPILMVDDEPGFLEAARLMLTAAGINNLVLCGEPRQALALAQEHQVSVVLLDMLMPNVSGRELLAQLSEQLPGTPVIIVTALDEVDSAVTAVRAGAFDYLVKPVDPGRLTTTVERAVQHHSITAENRALRESFTSSELRDPQAFAEIITADPGMFRIFQYLEAVAPTDKPVLITGDTGTGKELIARALHKASGRTGELVEVNVGGIDDAMLSDSLFGHKRGAFTGADAARGGLIERAAGGTIFLDEIGDLSPASQVKLLRLLQDGSYYPVGADVARASDARVVAATNVPSDTLRRGGKFRPDLFYRLQLHHVELPPLRQRKQDLALLFEHFVARAAVDMNKPKPTAPRELFGVLAAHNWPGNVRELEAMVFDAVSHHRSGVLSMERFLQGIGLSDESRAARSEEVGDKALSFGDPLPSLKDIENLLVEEALSRASGNQTLAARLLGVSRQALNNRLRRDRQGDLDKE